MEAYGSSLLSNPQDIQNGKSRLHIKCFYDHTWETTAAHLISDRSWCPQCSYDKKRGFRIVDLQEYAAIKGGKCLSTKYTNNKETYSWECKDGHQWLANWNNIIYKGKWCPGCSGNQKLTLQHCQEWALSKGGECLSAKYINALTPLAWRCHNKHVWEANFNNLKDKDSWCPYCSKKVSKKETAWLNILKVPAECRNKSLRVGERFMCPDGYDLDNKLIYEFYGDFWHGNPEVFLSYETNASTKTTFGELYDKTIKREKLIEAAGFTIVRMWEHDFDPIYYSLPSSFSWKASQ